MCGHSKDTIQPESYNDFVSQYGKLFLRVLSGFCIAFAVYLVLANIAFRNSQESIKQSYAQHIAKADSLYWDMISYNKDYVSHVSDVNATILSDSLIRLTLGQKQRLSTEQYNRLHELLSTQFAEIERLHNKYDTKIHRDSLLLITEGQVLEGQIKTMLDLHLNKIEHEYSNITLWAAVLTILFLVFSFYSIFKMDSLVHQGNEGVREIRKLSSDGEKTIQRVTEKGNALISNSKEKMNQLLEEANSRLTLSIAAQQQTVSETVAAIQAELSAIKAESENSKNVAVSAKERIEGVLDESVKILKTKLTEIENQYDGELKIKVEELNKYIEELQKIILEHKNAEERKEGKDEH